MRLNCALRHVATLLRARQRRSLVRTPSQHRAGAGQVILTQATCDRSGRRRRARPGPPARELRNSGLSCDNRGHRARLAQTTCLRPPAWRYATTTRGPVLRATLPLRSSQPPHRRQHHCPYPTWFPLPSPCGPQARCRSARGSRHRPHFLAPRSRRHGIRCRQWTGPPADRRRPLHGATFTPLSWRGFEDASSTQSRRNRDDRVRRCERRDTVRTRKHCESAAGFAREVLHNSLYAVIALAAFISLALSFIAANARLDQKERELRRHIARRTPIRTNRSQTKDRASV